MDSKCYMVYDATGFIPDPDILWRIGSRLVTTPFSIVPGLPWVTQLGINKLRDSGIKVIGCSSIDECKNALERVSSASNKKDVIVHLSGHTINDMMCFAGCPIAPEIVSEQLKSCARVIWVRGYKTSRFALNLSKLIGGDTLVIGSGFSETVSVDAYLNGEKVASQNIDAWDPGAKLPEIGIKWCQETKTKGEKTDVGKDSQPDRKRKTRKTKGRKKKSSATGEAEGHVLHVPDHRGSASKGDGDGKDASPQGVQHSAGPGGGGDEQSLPSEVARRSRKQDPASTEDDAGDS